MTGFCPHGTQITIILGSNALCGVQETAMACIECCEGPGISSRLHTVILNGDAPCD